MPRQKRADEATAPNQPPQITSTPAQVVEAQSTWIYEITATDPDDGPEPLSVILAAPPIPQTPGVTFTARRRPHHAHRLRHERQPDRHLVLRRTSGLPA